MPKSRLPLSEPSPRPTLRQIAEATGVSAMTVSRALRDNPRVTEALRRRIQTVAERMGYRPDPTVTKLMNHLRLRNKAGVVAGLAAITWLPEALETPQFGKIRESARARAEELGYRLEVFRVTEAGRFNRALERMLIGRGIEGVLLLQMPRPSAVDDFLKWQKFSVAIASPSVLGPDFPRVEANYFHNARLLCAEIARRGHRRIGFVGSHTFSVRTNEAFTAAAVWQNARHGGRAVRALDFATRDELRETLAPWFERERPDAIIVHFEELIPLLHEKLGLRPGGPVFLACSSVDGERRQCAGIDERPEVVGRKAVDVLTGMLNRNEKNVRSAYANTLIDGAWVEATGTR